MKIFLIKLGVLFALLGIGHGFLGILAPGSGPLILVASAVVSWTLLRGFPLALGAALPLVLLSDVLLDGRIGPASPLFVCTAYGVSFFSRRFFLEHRVAALTFYGLTAAFSAYLALVLGRFEEGGRGLSLFALPASLLSCIVLAALVFALVYTAISAIERVLERLYQEQTLNIR
jgi:hypothetical protein